MFLFRDNMALIALAASNGKVLDTKYNAMFNATKCKEVPESDLIAATADTRNAAGDMGQILPAVEILIMPRDNTAPGKATLEITASQGRGATVLGPMRIEVEVTATDVPVGEISFDGNGLVGTFIGFMKKRNA